MQNEITTDNSHIIDFTAHLLGGASKFNVLPDSRLADKNARSEQGLWECADGTRVRVEAIPAYCVSCGKWLSKVPKDTTVHIALICRKCYDRDPACFAGMVGSEEEFNRKLEDEMLSKYGRYLSDVELLQLYEDQNLSVGLQMLLRETPYPVPTYGH
jgi:hypothetical protein